LLAGLDEDDPEQIPATEQCLLLTQSGHRVGRWRSAGAIAEALSVNAKMVVPERPGRFYGVRYQFLVPILCFDADL
jgi:hypothetical protein